MIIIITRIRIRVVAMMMQCTWRVVEIAVVGIALVWAAGLQRTVLVKQIGQVPHFVPPNGMRGVMLLLCSVLSLLLLLRIAMMMRWIVHRHEFAIAPTTVLVEQSGLA